MSADSGNPHEKMAWILTFYAFKGGTGRTLTLSNVARYLAETRGYRIGLVDLDLESPGLPHQPLSPEWEEVETGTLPKARIDQSKGFVELFLSISDARPDARGIEPDHLSASVVPLHSVGGNGALFLMPAAIGSTSRSGKFMEALTLFDRRLAELGAGGNPNEFDHRCAHLTDKLLQHFIEQYSLDYVFIDGRTGLGSFYSVYAYQIPHALVLFCGLNEQNIQGSLDILNKVSPDSELSPAPVFLVASPTPTVGPGYLEKRLDSIATKLDELHEKRGSGAHYVYRLPYEAEYLLPYTDLASYQETYFIGDFPHSGLTREYLRLAQGIEALVLEDEPYPQVTTQPGAVSTLVHELEQLPNPLRIAAENIALEPLGDFIRDILGFEGAGVESVVGQPNCTRLVFRRERSEAAIEVDLWPATDPNAPWERLEGGEEVADWDMPHIVMIPQSSLATVSSNSGRLLPIDAGEFRERHIIEYEFLDLWYPGWRRWCTDQTGVKALPFSMNTTIFCANESHLDELCALYWMRKRVPPSAGKIFFPSNWHVLLEVVESAASAKLDFVPFAFARHRRALYYEWLNVVLTFGGADSEVGEGNILLDRWRPALTREGTVEGTEFFLRMIRANHAQSRRPSSRLGTLPRMDELVQCFWHRELSFFTGWTDSFRFDSEDTRAARTGVESRESSEPIRVRLGRVPRDIRHRRRPLVANWVAVLARSEAATASLMFMRQFLDPEAQKHLLWNGFPSASRPVVERMLQDCGTVPTAEGWNLSDRNRAIFLAALMDAFDNGYLVPSFPRSTEWINAATAQIDELVQWVEAARPVDERTVRGILRKMSETLQRLTAADSPERIPYHALL